MIGCVNSNHDPGSKRIFFFDGFGRMIAMGCWWLRLAKRCSQLKYYNDDTFGIQFWTIWWVFPSHLGSFNSTRCKNEFRFFAPRAVLLSCRQESTLLIGSQISSNSHLGPCLVSWTAIFVFVVLETFFSRFYGWLNRIPWNLLLMFMHWKS